MRRPFLPYPCRSATAVAAQCACPVECPQPVMRVVKAPVCCAIFTRQNEVGVPPAGPLEIILPQTSFKIGKMGIVDQVDHLPFIDGIGCSSVRLDRPPISLKFQYILVFLSLYCFYTPMRPANLYRLDLRMILKNLRTHEIKQRTFPRQSRSTYDDNTMLKKALNRIRYEAFSPRFKLG